MRQWIRPILTVAATILAAWGMFAIVAGFQAVSAVRDAETAFRELERSADLDRYLDGDLDAEIDTAIIELDDASAKLDAFVLKPLRVVPFVGRQLSSARALTNSGLELVLAMRETGRTMRNIIDDRGQTAIHDQLELVAAELAEMRDIVRSVDLGPIDGLTGDLARGRNEIAVQLAEVEPQLDNGSRLLFALSELFRGPEDHLLLIANNAESRAGSGMILTTGVFRSSNGQIVVTGLGSSFAKNLPVGSVELTETYTTHFEFLTPEAEWRNLAVTPRFPETAESALRMWTEATGEELDGVILVDPFVLRALLVGTGPVTVEDSEIRSDTVLDYLFHDQYLDLGEEFTNTERRAKELLVAVSVLDRLQRRDLDLVEMVPAVLAAAERRHLMLWSPRDDRQRVWRETGVDGELEANSLMVSSSNRSPSKLDYFVEIKAQLTSEIVDGIREVELLLAIDNTVDPAMEPRYVAGPIAGSLAEPGEYVGLVTLNLPGSATRGRFDGVEELSVSGADGPTRIIATTVSVLPGGRQWLTARFELPLGVDSIQIEPSARVEPVAWTVGDRRVTDDRRWVVSLS